MKVTPIKTRLVRANECSIETLISESLSSVEENTVIAVSSKVIALCQNRVVDIESISKPDLIKREAERYTPDGFNRYGSNFTIINNSFVPAAGIDESNADGHFVLWPENPQDTANSIREFICRHFAVERIGVIVIDSNSLPPLRAGTIGIMLAHSGFEAIKHLAGTVDLFGRPFKVATSAIGSGLAAAATVAMGEGSERTPLALLSDLPFVSFQARNPTPKELSEVYISPEDDLYAPFLMNAPWQPGGKHSK